MSAGKLDAVVSHVRQLAGALNARTLTDADLLDRYVSERDEAAFAALLQRHGGLVWSVCRRLLSRAEDVEDAFQATFLILIRKAGSVRRRGAVASWLYGVAYRIAMKAKKSASRKFDPQARKPAREPEQPVSMAALRELQAMLDQEIDRLPEKLRAPFVLCCLEGSSRAETARELGLKEGTVAGRVAEARKLLQKHLTRRGVVLTTALCAGTLYGPEAYGLVPAALATATLRLAVCDGSSVASAGALRLARGVLEGITMSKAKMGAALALTLSLLAGGLTARQARVDQPTPEQRSNAVGSFGVRASVADEKTAAETPQAPAKTKAVVSGFVKDSEDRPVAGATVVLANNRCQDKPLVVQSGLDGSFAFIKLPAVIDNLYALELVAGKAGYAPARGWATGDEDARNNQKVLKLAKVEKISGSVRDTQGRPVTGALLEFGTVERTGNISHWGYAPIEAVRGSALEPLWFTRSDRNGSFQFSTVPADKELIFRVWADGFADLDTAADHATGRYRAKPGAPPVQFTLNQGGRVDGRVVARVPGVKLGDLHVWLEEGPGSLNSGLYKQTWTNPEGQFHFVGLSEGSFRVEMDDSPPESSWTVKSTPTVTVQSGKATDVQLELIEGVVVEGQVLAGDTGKPMAKAAVGGHGPARPKEGHAIFRVKTHADGRYRLRLPPGATEFYVQTPLPGYLQSERKSVVIPDDVKTWTGPTLTVVRSTVLEGHVLDVRGTPVARAEIIGLCQGGTYQRLGGEKVPTDDQGHFLLAQSPYGSFAPGQATGLQIMMQGGRIFEANTVTVARGQVEVCLPTVVTGDARGPEVVLPDELAGVVVDDKGSPLEGVHVHVWDWVNEPENQTHTGKDGVFRIKDCGRRAKVEVRFRKQGYSPVLFVQQAVGVKGLVVAMDQKTYFEGAVHGPDGKPAANALIRADQGPKNAEGVVITTVWTETKTDASGRYRLYVEPDAYEFLVKAPGVGVTRLPKTPIAHGEAKPLDIQLQPGITFRALTTDAQSHRPVPGVRLWHWQHKGVEGTSDAAGQVVVSEMLPGPFSFQVEAPGYARWWSEDALSQRNRLQPSMRPGSKWQRNFDELDFEMKPGMLPVGIVLEKGVRITGQVLDPDNKPVAGATVAPAHTGTGNSLTGDTSFSVTTKPDGTFDMLLPASGEAEYNLVAHDGKYQQWRQWANGVLPPMRTTPGQTIERVTLTLTKPAMVRGIVVDAQGKPVGHREVRAHAADKHENRYYDPTTTTKDDGSFELRFIRPGEQYIQTAPFWTAEEAPPETTRKLKLVEGQTAEGITLTAGEARQILQSRSR